jgi:DNA repair protein RecN (Recombination protein N)
VLTNITIQNIVLIEKLAIDFASGLCVLSGETGSGKSILLDSLGLATGERSNSRLLRKDCKQGVVVAGFDISNNEICQEILAQNGLEDSENKNTLTLKRILQDNSTSKSFVNDIPTSLNLLTQIGNSLIEIHGQSEQRWLLNNSYHRQILDQFARHDKLVKSVSQKYQKWHEVESKIKELNSQKDKNEREIDYLSHITQELEAANIEEGEEDALIQKRNFLSSKEKISNLMLETQKDVNDADSKLSFTQKNLINNKDLSDDLGEDSSSNFSNIIDILDEISNKNDLINGLIDEISQNIGSSDETLEEIEERLFLIRNLSRKFNKTIDELPEFLEKSKEELNVIVNYQAISGDLENQKTELKKEYLQDALKLSKSRKAASLQLSKKVEAELLYLKMGNVKFLAQIDDLEESNYSLNGVDSIKFLAAINQNSHFDQISKVASGGELSRFMLALKVALLEVKSVPILIFDEIDSGIGGAVANAVGERLKLLAQKLQIIVVTHHAQVASKSNHHLHVRKEDLGDKTNTIIKILDDSDKENEIARMLSGEDISPEARAAARKLMVN